ncbi:hypothetical protein D3C79_890400 [compost metagenome]
MSISDTSKGNNVTRTSFVNLFTVQTTVTKDLVDLTVYQCAVALDKNNRLSFLNVTASNTADGIFTKEGIVLE